MSADQAVTIGGETAIRELYREDPRVGWEDWTPEDIDIDPEESSDTKKYALIVRREKRVGGKSALVLHSITIQSPWIRKLLDDVFEGFKGITTKLKDLTLNAPFHEFFYRWDRFQGRIMEETNSGILEHIRLLQTVIEPEIKPHLEMKEDLICHGLVTFNYLWALFEPGAVVHAVLDGHDRLYNLVSSRYRQSGEQVLFNLECRYVDCNGSSFGYVPASPDIFKFEGIKAISELQIVPVHLHPQTKEIQAKLRERGRTFEQLNGFHFKSYTGLYITTRMQLNGSNRHNVG